MGAPHKVMGPVASTPGFTTGNVVKIISDECNPFFKESDIVGTIIESFVDIDIDSLERIEKVFVLWSDSSSGWHSVKFLQPIPT